MKEMSNKVSYNCMLLRKALKLCPHKKTECRQDLKELRVTVEIQLKREVLTESVLSISQIMFANTICVTYMNAQILQGQNWVHYCYEFLL